MYIKAAVGVSALFFIIIIIFVLLLFLLSRHGGRALPPTHEIETVRQYRTPKSCSVYTYTYIYIYEHERNIIYQPCYHYVIPGYSRDQRPTAEQWRNRWHRVSYNIIGRYRPAVVSRCETFGHHRHSH